MFEQQSDVIDVRPDEIFDETAVHQYLKENELPGSENSLTVRQFGGGAANLTYLLDLETVQYVLRRPPLGKVAKSAHDMGREYKVLSVLHQELPTAPCAYLYQDSPNLIGAPFFIMERKSGVVTRKKMVDPFKTDASAPRKMSEALVDTLVDFHAVDYASISLSDLGKPQGFISRQIEGWHRRWEKAKTHDLPEMDTVYDWLLTNQTESPHHSLVHNDYKLDNVMFANELPPKLIAIFDWDMCTLGDPLSDLGSLLTYWVEPTDPQPFQLISSMPVGDFGFMTRAELVARYAEKSGRDVSNVNFYYTLGLYRLTVILAQIYIRFVKGQTQDQRFAALEHMIPLVAQKAQAVSQNDLKI